MSTARTISAAEAATRSIQRIYEEADQRAIETLRQREQSRRKGRIASLRSEKSLRSRTQVAMAGVSALCNFGQHPSIRSLIEARGRPLMIWGETGNRFSGMVKDSAIQVTMTEVMVVDRIRFQGKAGYDRDFDPIYLSFPLSVQDPLLHYTQLRRIASPYRLDWEMAEHFLEKEGTAHEHTRDIIFEVLCECADEEGLERWLLKAIN